MAKTLQDLRDAIGRVETAVGKIPPQQPPQPEIDFTEDVTRLDAIEAAAKVLAAVPQATPPQ